MEFLLIYVTFVYSLDKIYYLFKNYKVLFFIAIAQHIYLYRALIYYEDLMLCKILILFNLKFICVKMNVLFLLKMINMYLHICMKYRILCNHNFCNEWI